MFLFEIVKVYVDLDIEYNMYIKPTYIYLHFFILNLALEINGLIEKYRHIFQLNIDAINEFRVLIYLFGLKYFEFDKQRRSISNKVTLSEIEQILLSCVDMIKNDDFNTNHIHNVLMIHSKKAKEIDIFVHNIKDKYRNESTSLDKISNLLIYLIESEINNLRYWNSPSTFHKQDKKLIPTVGSLLWKEEKIKEVFESAFLVSHILPIKLIQRYPWIEKKFPKEYIDDLGKQIYEVIIVFEN